MIKECLIYVIEYIYLIMDSGNTVNGVYWLTVSRQSDYRTIYIYIYMCVCVCVFVLVCVCVCVCVCVNEKIDT